MALQLKRVYEDPSPKDGTRILVERLWPRGLTKERAKVDLWMKDVSPTPELRKWFNHDPEKWPEFKKRYWKELNQNGDSISELKKVIKKGASTLVYAAKDEEHNSAVALKLYLAQM